MKNAVRRRLAAARRQALGYPEIGESLSSGPPPSGYRLIERTAEFDGGFAAARERLFGWEMQRKAGIAVHPPDARCEAGATVLLRRWFLVLPVYAPCRVVRVIDEEGCAGFAYGTLTGHPECGEESFVLREAADGTLTFTIRAFSKPARWYSRLGRVPAMFVQDAITRKYLTALADRAT
ncbi:DUF1990 family protein [Amycolatopsis sp. NPDC004747]